MARAIRETIVDDLDGTPADTTMDFAISGQPYEIDLSLDNLQRWWQTWEPWLKAARKVTIISDQRGRSRGKGVWTDPAKVRGFCDYAGIPVSRTGIPSPDAQKEYLKAWLAGEVPARFR